MALSIPLCFFLRIGYDCTWRFHGMDWTNEYVVDVREVAVIVTEYSTSFGGRSVC